MQSKPSSLRKTRTNHRNTSSTAMRSAPARRHQRRQQWVRVRVRRPRLAVAASLRSQPTAACPRSTPPSSPSRAPSPSPPRCPRRSLQTPVCTRASFVCCRCALATRLVVNTSMQQLFPLVSNFSRLTLTHPRLLAPSALLPLNHSHTCPCSNSSCSCLTPQVSPCSHVIPDTGLPLLKSLPCTHRCQACAVRHTSPCAHVRVWGRQRRRR